MCRRRLPSAVQGWNGYGTNPSISICTALFLFARLPCTALEVLPRLVRERTFYVLQHPRKRKTAPVAPQRTRHDTSAVGGGIEHQPGPSAEDRGRTARLLRGPVDRPLRHLWREPGLPRTRQGRERLRDKGQASVPDRRACGSERIAVIP